MNSHQPIGIFDSGIGGLTVLKEIEATLPNEDLIYLGDTARLPYGPKSPETIIKYSIQNTLYLLEKNVKAVVVACNTASALALGRLQGNFKVPILGVIEPGATEAAAKTQSQKIGIIGTIATIRSEAYQKALKLLNSKTKITAQACPLLASMAEEGWCEGPIVDQILDVYLKPLRQTGEMDTLILACTHYPVFKKALSAYFGNQVTLVDSAIQTALALQATLSQLKLLNARKEKGTTLIFSTDAPDRMREIGHLFLGKPISDVIQVEVDR